LRRGVDVEHRLDVVVADHGRRAVAADRAQTAEDLRALVGAGRGDRQALQARQRVDAVLRNLGDDRIGHAVLGVQPEGRRDLRAAGQRGDHAVGDVALGQAQLGDARAVDVDPQLRRAGRLLQAHVGQAPMVFRRARILAA
jgi:hypothetical protein